MDRCELFGYRVEVDMKATRDWYRNAGEWGCECGHCRNFLNLAKSRKLPISVSKSNAIAFAHSAKLMITTNTKTKQKKHTLRIDHPSQTQ